MKPTTAIVLGLLLAGLVVVIVVTGLSRPGSEEQTGREDESERNVFAEKFGQADALTIQPAEGAVLTFTKEDGTWKIVKPLAARAAAEPIQAVLDKLEYLTYVWAFAPGDPAGPSDADAGLAPPRWTITARDAEGHARVLHVGAPTPTHPDTRTYVRPAGSETTYVVAVNFRPLLDRRADAYRSKDLLEVPAAQIARVRVDGRARFELVKDLDDVWHLHEPLQVRADAEAVEDLLDALTGLKAKALVTDRPQAVSDYGLDEPRLTVEVTAVPKMPAADKPKAQADDADAPDKEKADADATKKEDEAPADRTPRTVALEFGSRTRTGEEVFVRRRGEQAVWRVDGDDVADLEPKIADLRTKRVAFFEPADVQRVRLTVGDASAELARTEDGWQMRSPRKGKANGPAVEDLLTTLADLKAAAWTNDPVRRSTAGLDAPRARLTLLGEQDKPLASLVVGSPSSTGQTTAVAGSATDEWLAIVSEEAADDLLAEPASYWDPTILAVPQDASVVHVLLKRPDHTVELRRAEGRWRLIQPLEAAADEDAARHLAEALRDLRADRIIALGDAVPERYAGAPSRVEATFTVEIPPPKPEPADDADAAAAETPAPADTGNEGSAGSDAGSGAAAERDNGADAAPADAASATRTAETPAETPDSPADNGKDPNAASEPDAPPAAQNDAAGAGPTDTQKPAEADGPDATPDEAQAVPQGERRTYQVVAVRMGDATYVWRPDRPAPVAVGRFPAQLYETLIAELRDRSVVRMDADAVRTVRIRTDTTLELRQKGDGSWTCPVEPTVEIDADAVRRYIRQVVGVRARRFVARTVEDPKQYGVDDPWFVIELEAAEGEGARLVVSNEPSKETETRYASASGVPGVFLLPADTLGELTKTLKDFRKSDAETKSTYNP